MAMLAVAGLTIRLVQRLDVRHDPTSASPAAASVAAAGPCSSNSRKIAISPAVNEFFERGTRNGTKPASIEIAAIAKTSARSSSGNADSARSVWVRTATPISAVIHQYAVVSGCNRASGPGGGRLHQISARRRLSLAYLFSSRIRALSRCRKAVAVTRSRFAENQPFAQD
jgi:hypothetical protein